MLAELGELLLGGLCELLEGCELLGELGGGLLLDGLLLELGGDELGEGGCGVVGLLALGQPLSTRHKPAAPASLISWHVSNLYSPFRRVIGPGYTFSCYRFAIFKTWPEPRAT